MSLGAAQSSSPLADAAMRGDKAAVSTLIKQGVDVGAAQGDGMTALHWAAERGDAEMAEMLVYAGANVSAVTRIGLYTPLHLAAKAGNAAVAKVLDQGRRRRQRQVEPERLDADAPGGAVGQRRRDQPAGRREGRRQRARSRMGTDAADLRGLRESRRGGDRVDQARRRSRTWSSKTIDVSKQGQLDRAAVERQRKVIEGFVGKDSDKRPTPAQMQAAIEASREVLRSGKIPPPDPNAPPPRGFNPEEINPPVSTKGGMTALLHAARQGYLDAATALLDGGADINKTQAGDNTSPLLTAIINGQFDMAMLLIKRGADPNLVAKNNGVSPLWAAVNTAWQPRTRFPQPQEMELQKHTYLEVMQALLDKGANVNHRITSHPGISSTPAAATATAVLPTRPVRRRSGAPPTAPT